MSKQFMSVLAIIVIALSLSLSVGAQASRLNVVASHGILADVASQVAGDQANVTSLIPVGADPHAFTPSPSDLIAVAEADLVLINGAGYEETLLEAIENAGEMVNIAVASACVELIPGGAAMRDDHHDDHDDHADEHDDDHADEHDADHADEHDDEHADEHDDDHADEHDADHADEHDDDHDDDHADEHDDDHADEHDDDHDDHAHESVDCDAYEAEVAAIVGEASAERSSVETLGREQDVDCGGGQGHEEDEHGHHHGEGACDPHMWMDPHNVIHWVLHIRDLMSAQDPDHAAEYSANAAAYAEQLVALEADFILPALMDLPAEQRVLVTSHDAAGYLATAYGFELVITVAHGISTMADTSAQDVAAVIDVLRDEDIPAIFGDPFAPQAIMTAIAEETGVQLVGFYSDTLGEAGGPAGTYLDYMRYNFTVIVEALAAGQ